MKTRLTRRSLLASAAAAPLALNTPLTAATPGPPPYTLSINIEVMFPRTMPKADRIQVVADQGFKAYGFWNASEEEQDAMLKVQQKTGLKCTGSGAKTTSPRPRGRTYSRNFSRSQRTIR